MIRINKAEVRIVFGVLIFVLAVIKIQNLWRDAQLPSEPWVGTMCGVTTQQVEFDQEGKLTSKSTRVLFFDLDTSILWMGSNQESQGQILAYNLKTKTLEACLEAGVTVNAIFKWQGDMFFATNGQGVAQLHMDGRRAEWTFHRGEMDWQGHDLAIDPRNGDLLVSTGTGIYSFDGETWENFDLIPPDATMNFQVILPVSEDEWYLGSMSQGTYHYVDGDWERFDSQGKWLWQEQSWVNPFMDVGIFPNTVFDLELREDGAVMIAGDAPGGHGLIFLAERDLNQPHLFGSYSPIFQNFDRVTSVQLIGNEVLIAANLQLGAYYQNWKGEVLPLTGVQTFDVVSLADYTYLATRYGVVRVELPFESSIQTTD